MIWLFLAGICAISVLGWLFPKLIEAFAFSCQSRRDSLMIYRWVTYSLLHLNAAHLAGNIIGLVFTIAAMSHVLTPEIIVLSFVAGVLTPAIGLTICPRLGNPGTYYIGSSTGLFALLATGTVLAPNGYLLFMFVLKVPSGIALVVIFYLSVFFHMAGVFPRIWHFGHALGLAAGYVVGLIYSV